MAESILLGILDPVKIKDSRLFLVAIPLMLAVFPPPVDNRLHVKFPIRPGKRSSRLSPDQTRTDLKPGIFEGIIKYTALGCGVELIDGSVLCHDLMEVGEGLHQEFIAFLVGKVVVCNLAGGGFQVDEVRSVGADQINLGVTEQLLIGFRVRGVAADHSVPSQVPDVSGLGKARFLQLGINIEVILFTVLTQIKER